MSAGFDAETIISSCMLVQLADCDAKHIGGIFGIFDGFDTKTIW